ncbi:MAG: HDOD domain-containing protein [Marinobacter sp.]|nr:HDOD domain-containing protein [Marinobacter sp.]
MPDNQQSKIPLLAAQPIHDREDKVFAVELLYRNDLSQSALDVGEGRATSELLFNLCTGITEQTDHYSTPAFINVSADFIRSGAFLPIEPERVVVELVERLTPTPELVECVAEWHRKGFRFAFDDFEFGDSWEALLPFAYVIKVDVETSALEQAIRYRTKHRQFEMLWLAERVEDQACRDRYFNAGFDLFQGYFFAKPTLIMGEKLSPSAVNLARLIGVLFADEPDTGRITECLSQDPPLAINLLKVVNSPVYRGVNKINSLTEVIVRLGLENLRRWVVLIGSLNAASPETARLVLVRAQACFELASRTRQPLEPTQAFLVGLLSGVDLLLQVDRDAFIRQLDLSTELQEAITLHKGPLGQILRIIINVEKAVALKHRLANMDERLLVLYRDASLMIQAVLKEVG